jgi:hypothetical protein
MLVKRTSDKAGIEDIVIIENKLSSGTDLTERQLEGFTQISKTGTITAREAKAGYWNGQYEFKNLRDKCVKLFDHGKDDVQVVEASPYGASVLTLIWFKRPAWTPEISTCAFKLSNLKILR